MRLVAVVLSYNNKSYLNECLTSVIKQTRPPDLILFCDDGSTDGSVELGVCLLSNSGIDFRILCRPNNSGTLINLLSVVPFIDPDDVLILCDADDISLLNRFDVIFSRFSGSSIDGYGHAAQIIDSNGNVIVKHYFQNRRIRLDGVRNDCFVYELHGACLSVRGKFILELPAPTHKELFQDVFLAFFASINASSFLIEPEDLLLYRRHSNANSNCGSNMDYSGFLLDEIKAKNNSLRLYNLHNWLEWYIQAADLVLDNLVLVSSHFNRAKGMHLVKYEFGSKSFFKRVGAIAFALLSKNSSWKWLFYRIFGTKFYFYLLRIRLVARETLSRAPFRAIREWLI